MGNKDIEYDFGPVFYSYTAIIQGPLLLTWIKLNPSMDK